MEDKANRRVRVLQTRIMLTALGGAVAGATRALTEWLLSQWH